MAADDRGIKHHAISSHIIDATHTFPEQFNESIDWTLYMLNFSEGTKTYITFYTIPSYGHDTGN